MPISLTLGDFTFDGTFECPQVLNGGGVQNVVTHDMLGGVRQADSMGAFDNDIGWNGTFIGITAEDRVKYLNGLRKAGKPLVLAYSTFQFLVVIKSFTWSFKPNFFIDYVMVCTVIEDQTQPINIILPSAFNDTVLVDLAEALALAELVANPSVTSTLALLNAAITNVPNLGGASNADLAGILAAAQAALDAINQVTATAKGIGYQTPSITESYVNAHNLAQEIEALEAQWEIYANAYELGNVVTRIQRNVQIAMSPTGISEQVINKNLFQLAVEEYGDAMLWTAIAQANQFTIQNADGFPDPFIDGTKTLIIPPKPATPDDGIMNYA